MPRKAKPKTLDSLRSSGYKVISVRSELRRNLIQKIKNKEKLFPGIIGYDETVIPQVENAILSSQDIILLGERGQAKSRLIRSLVNLLDPDSPAVEGCEINDNPYNPICKACQIKSEEMGGDLPIVWINRSDRYTEKLATPDISIADLIGEVDPIKVAEGRYLSDELTIHYGLLPRTNRGIFCINELPDLSERIQVGLFNVMEERDIQIKGYRISLPLDVYLVATANAEDYTNRGRIITPLKDRYGAQIRTHYPTVVKDEILIVDQERASYPNENEVYVPYFMKRIVAEITALARTSSDINQRSGVSVRVSISNHDTIVGNALRRSILLREKKAVPRITDLPYIVTSFTGKIELETFEEGREGRLIEDLTKKALINVFGRHFNLRELEPIVKFFDEGETVETSSETNSEYYVDLLRRIESLSVAVKQLETDGMPEAIASAVEFVLEGLHLNRRLNRDRVEKGFSYRS